MEIVNLEDNKNILKLKVNSEEESLFSLIKTYLQENKDVDIVGVNRDHHLVDETELLVKVKSKSAKDLLKKSLGEIKKDLTSKKIK